MACRRRSGRPRGGRGGPSASCSRSTRAMGSSRKSTSSWRPPNLPPSASIRSEFPVTCSPFPVTFRRSAVLLSIALLCPGAVKAQSGLVLRWGGDAEGGAPYVEADPNDPSRVVGFDVEVAQLLAAGL